MHKTTNNIVRFIAIFLLVTGCSSPPPQKSPPIQAKSSSTGLQPPPSPEHKKNDSHSKLFSPYSTEGLITLNEYRTANTQLNDFLLRNRKPDYFFSGIKSEYQFQKIYLIYLASDNLYLFDSSFSEPYKKFHPLPAYIKKRIPVASIQQVPPVSTMAQPAFSSNNESLENHAVPEIEQSLSISNPQPDLTPQLLGSIAAQNKNENTDSLYPQTYFLDKPLSSFLENSYSEKYDEKKRRLKIIFPVSYTSDTLYATKNHETKKIIFHIDSISGREISLVVPDFLPGAEFYQSTRNNMEKAFSSLYQVTLPSTIKDHKKLRMRYQIRICQTDQVKTCSTSSGGQTQIRAIVIAMTLYDGETKTPIETMVIK